MQSLDSLFVVNSIKLSQAEINTIMYSTTRESQLIEFLQEELNISASFILLALNLRKHKIEPISMILWQYGLITVKQLEQILDWLEC